MEPKVQIICVINNYKIFNSMIKKNKFMNIHQIHVYDNTINNVGVPDRYNHFIKNCMQNNTWLIFCHQDFCFLEDFTKKLFNLNKNFLYGPIGATLKRNFFFRHYII